MTIDPESSLPLYAQVEAVLAASIADGTYPPGSRLPNEESLLERFGVSRTTLQKTVQNLIKRGLIEIRRGKGTFVTQPKITQELTELSGFVEDMRALGRHPTARLVDRQVVPANDRVARQLGWPLARWSCVSSACGSRTACPSRSTKPGCRKISAKRLSSNDLETEPIFSLLEQKYDMPLVEAEYRLEATCADETVAQALGIAPGQPDLPDRAHLVLRGPSAGRL